MADKIVTVARFFDPLAAQMVKNQLEAAGIPAMLGGETAGELFAGFGGAVGSIHVQVAEANLSRALAILETGEEDLDEDETQESTAITDREAFKQTMTSRRLEASAAIPATSCLVPAAQQPGKWIGPPRMIVPVRARKTRKTKIC